MIFRPAAALPAAMLACLVLAGPAHAWQGCFDSRQQQIVNEFTPRVNGAAGICQQGRVSTDMWLAVERAARECGAPANVIAEVQSYVQQSRAVADASCT